MAESNLAAGFTCREVYEEGAALLAGMEDAALDARLLLEHFCGISTHRLLSDPGLPVRDGARDAFLEGVRRRAAREPLAYITGEREFMGLPFIVSPDVLIPEQDTENLAEEALRVLDDGSRILDLCTGSGCILLSLLRYSNGCVGIGTDISATALAVAEQNARALGLTERCTWLQGDLFEALRTSDDAGATPVFDLIVSNPPYLTKEDMGELQKEVTFEPQMALYGGEDGLVFYKYIAENYFPVLKAGGYLLFEIGCKQADALCEILKEKYTGIKVVKDYGGNDRVVIARKEE